MIRAVIVQDVESRSFLTMGPDGDVVFTPWVNEAGAFYDEQEAIETAEIYCPEGFHLFSHIVDDEVRA